MPRIAQTTQAREQQPVQQQPFLEMPSTWTWGAVLSVAGTFALFGLWVVYDRTIKPRQYSWLTRYKRPYEDMEAIANQLQTIRGETGADRAVLMELNSKRGTMIGIAQETANRGIAKIEFSARDNQGECVKKILLRFNDQPFVFRETEKITNASEYQGFLNDYNTSYVIYYKIGEKESTSWVLALHFPEFAYANYETSLSLKSRIEQICSVIFYRVLQRSPVEGLIK